LGSAAGYGSSFPINRIINNRIVGFDDLHYNVVYAQMSRGKTERIVASALATLLIHWPNFQWMFVYNINQNFGSFFSCRA